MNKKEFVLLDIVDQREAEIIESLLNQHNINVLIKHQESGGYFKILMGRSFLGVEIYVQQEKAEKAQSIIDEQKYENRNSKDNDYKNIDVKDSEESIEYKIMQKFKLAGKIIIFIYILFLIGPTVMQLIAKIKNLVF